MSTPFGFGLPEDPDESGGRPDRCRCGRPSAPTTRSPPCSAAARRPADIGAAFQQLGQLLSYEGGPVNWDLARDIARQAVAAGAATRRVGRGRARARSTRPCASPTCGWTRATALPAGGRAARAWSRAEWVEATLPAWQELVDPVAERGRSTAMGRRRVPEEMQRRWPARCSA